MSAQSTLYKIKMNGDADSKAGLQIQASNSVRISVRQPAAQPIKVPPPVAPKPKRRPHPPTASAAIYPEDDVFDFPPPPPELLQATQPRRPTDHPCTNTTKPLSIEDELDALTDILTLSLQNTNDPEFFGMCSKCRNKISGIGLGCTAMGRTYHVACFVCSMCACVLTKKEFYDVESTPYCEPCYHKTLHTCVVCKHKITQRILRASEQCYHPECFSCTSCGKNMDGVSYTLDAADGVHCVECYQVRFSPRCAACSNLIMSNTERGDVVYVVAMQKNYHVHCYRCEDCDIVLSGDGVGQRGGCYPLDERLLCFTCNGIRIQCRKNVSRSPNRLMSTEL